MKKCIPTERDVLRAIYDMHEDIYPRDAWGKNDPLLSIDVKAVAKNLQCSPELLFGYLYYFLDHKHKYQTGPNTYVHLFVIQAGSKRHVVNFPYLAAILAGHDQEHSKYRLSIAISLIALSLSVGSIVAQLITN